MKDLALSVQDVTYQYSGGISLFGNKKPYSAFENVSFDVRKGESIALEGRNGAGKSTLLRIISGIIKPSKGKVITNGLSTALITLGFGFDPNISGRRNSVLQSMLMGVSRQAAESSIEAVKEFSELGEFFERPVRTYSSGMRARLAFSTVINVSADILLIDEVLAVGDRGFKQKSREAMVEKIKSGATVILVSHSKEDAKKLCNRSVNLDEIKKV